MNQRLAVRLVERQGHCGHRGETGQRGAGGPRARALRSGADGPPDARHGWLRSRGSDPGPRGREHPAETGTPPTGSSFADGADPGRRGDRARDAGRPRARPARPGWTTTSRSRSSRRRWWPPSTAAPPGRPAGGHCAAPTVDRPPAVPTRRYRGRATAGGRRRGAPRRGRRAFVQSCGQHRAELMEATRSGDWARVGRIAHAVKGASAWSGPRRRSSSRPRSRA